MRASLIRGKSYLGPASVLIAAGLLVIPPSASAAPQGEGGAIKPLPTPTPTTVKTTPPRRGATGTPARPGRKGETDKAGATSDEIAFWNTIKGSRSPEDFRDYLKKFPKGEHADVARLRLDRLEADAWEKVKDSTRVEDLRQFLDKYPDGDFADRARARINFLMEEAKRAADEAAWWEKIKSSTKPEDFRDFLQSHPNGEHADAARGRLKDLEETAAWELVKNSNRIEDLNEFLKKYRDGKFADQANARLIFLTGQAMLAANEAALWEKIKGSKNPEDFRGYLKTYPGGGFVEKARARLRELAGTVVRNQIGMEFAWIPPGRFVMGEKVGYKEAAHEVTIGQGFYMGRYEVTIGEWRAVMGDVTETMKKEGARKFKESERQPMIFISWENIKEFIRRLNTRNDGFTYRLPTEAEWEYAARAGTTTDFAFGNSLSTAQANYKVRKKTLPVGSFKPNAWGLYDMHGNVWEFVEDVWHDYYTEDAPKDGSAWLSGGISRRVIRGGSWEVDYHGALRSAYRFWFPENLPNSDSMGFRVVAVARE